MRGGEERGCPVSVAVSQPLWELVGTIRICPDGMDVYEP